MLSKGEEAKRPAKKLTIIFRGALTPLVYIGKAGFRLSKPLLGGCLGEHSAQRANMPGSGSAHLLTPFEALSSVNRSRSASRVYKPFSFQCSPFESSVGAFSILIRVGVAREQSVPPCHSRESVYSRDCCHSQQG